MKGKEQEIIRKVADFIQRYGLMSSPKLLVVSVSGGADSMVLLHLLIKLGYEISSIVHFNHNVRPEAEADAEFVKLVGKSLGLPVQIVSLPFGSENMANFEAKAHKMRSAFFNKMNREQDMYVAMGHHADDVLETTLLNLLRGGGLNILGGIPAYNHPVVRPILCLTRHEIRYLAEKWELSWVEDSSNEDIYYTRNFLRKEIIPLMKLKNPKLAGTHFTSAMRFQKLYDFVNGAVDGGIGYIVSSYEPLILNVARMQEMTDDGEPVEEVMYKLLKPYGIKFAGITGVLDLVTASIGTIWQSEQISFIRKEKEIQQIDLGNLDNEGELDALITLEDEHFIGPDFILHHYEADNSVSMEPDAQVMRLYVPLSKINWPLRISRFEAGDKIALAGMKGRKEVAHLLAENGIPPLLRKYQTIVRDSGGEIVWIPGIRVGKSWANKTISTPARLFHFSKK